jgi:hypothetical protein
MTVRSVTAPNQKNEIQESSSDDEDKVVRDTTKRKAPTHC